MPIQLADSRALDAMTADQADQLFAALAQADIRLKKAQAAAEKKISEIKAACLADTAADAETVRTLSDRLSDYVLAHRDRFQKPRQRETAYGKYGLRTATKLEITDEEALIAFAQEFNLPILDTKVTIDKKAVLKAMADGLDPELSKYAQIITGVLASYDIDRKLLVF